MDTKPQRRNALTVRGDAVALSRAASFTVVGDVVISSVADVVPLGRACEVWPRAAVTTMGDGVR